MSKLDDLHRKWMKDPEYQTAFNEMKPEFELARSLIQARVEAGLTQKQVAAKMKTPLTAVARLESGRGKPSTTSLERYASVVGKRVKISLEPV